jgi:hypothetical protein
MNLLHEALVKCRRESPSATSQQLTENLQSTERSCDRREHLRQDAFLKKRKGIFIRFWSILYHWKIAILMGCFLSGIFFVSRHFPLEAQNALLSTVKKTTDILVETGTSTLSQLRHIFFRQHFTSQQKKISEYLKQIKIQDVQTSEITCAKIRIGAKIYLPGAVISEDPYVRFVGIEQKHIVFEDRENQRYSYLIEAILE